MKKKLSPYHIPEYIPARLVEGKARWHIVYTYKDGYTNITHRPKPTYNLNRIKSIKLRRKTGRDIVAQLNKLLPLGYPWKQIEDENAVLSVTDLREAVEFAVKMKTADLTERTVSSYASMVEIFLSHIEGKFKKITVAHFKKKHVQSFLDYLTVDRRTRRGERLSNKSYNTYLFLMKGIWKILIDREYTAFDPWQTFKQKKVKEKTARDYSPEELRIIVRRVGQEDKYLLLAILLEYYCFIRPTELTKLRVRDLRIDDNRIMLSGEITKNGKNRTPTVPRCAIDFIKSFQFESFGSNSWIFGRKKKRAKIITTCADFKVSYKVFNNRLKKIIRQLHSEGALSDIRGMIFYGMKDTGATDLIEQGINAYELMQQLGHSSLNQTQIYLVKKKKTIQPIVDHKTDILSFTDLSLQDSEPIQQNHKTP